MTGTTDPAVVTFNSDSIARVPHCPECGLVVDLALVRDAIERHVRSPPYYQGKPLPLTSVHVTCPRDACRAYITLPVEAKTQVAVSIVLTNLGAPGDKPEGREWRVHATEEHIQVNGVKFQREYAHEARQINERWEKTKKLTVYGREEEAAIEEEQHGPLCPECGHGLLRHYDAATGSCEHVIEYTDGGSEGCQCKLSRLTVLAQLTPMRGKYPEPRKEVPLGAFA